MNAAPVFRNDANINWYRTPIDRQLLKHLMQRSDWSGLRQALGHLGLFALTGTLAFLAYRQVNAANWFWSVPLVLVFLLTGNWILILIVNLGSHTCGWLQTLCGVPQHYGMCYNVPDHRLCCRTYTCRGLPAFLYWNMQYHIEHHMYPRVPFHNLPKLHAALKHDMPPAPHGLREAWRGMLAIRRRVQADPNYCYVPPLPASAGGRENLELLLKREPALAG